MHWSQWGGQVAVGYYDKVMLYRRQPGNPLLYPRDAAAFDHWAPCTF
jgi:hypothetical protein